MTFFFICFVWLLFWFFCTKSTAYQYLPSNPNHAATNTFGWNQQQYPGQLTPQQQQLLAQRQYQQMQQQQQQLLYNNNGQMHANAVLAQQQAQQAQQQSSQQYNITTQQYSQLVRHPHFAQGRSPFFQVDKRCCVMPVFDRKRIQFRISLSADDIQKMLSVCFIFIAFVVLFRVSMY